MRAARWGGLLSLLLAGTACDGENLYRALPGPGGSRSDASAPEVELLAPAAEHRVAVGDSVLVRVRVRDPQGIRALELRGVAVRGDARLGTQTLVERFAPKRVDIDSARVVRDTTILRYLLTAGDTLPDDSVLIVASARDAGGNVRADTVAVSVGGPRVQILFPNAGSEIRAGALLRVRVSAASPTDRIQELTLRADSAFALDTTLRFDPPVSAADTVILIPIPDDAAGHLRLRAAVRTVTNDSASTAGVVLGLLPPALDRRPPVVAFTVNAAGRAETDDSVAVTVMATDSTQVAQVGVSLRPIHRLATRTDTLTVLSLVSSGDRATFRFSLEQLGVPQPTDTSTLRLEVTAFARDAAGNCATATVPGTALSEACDSTGGRVFAARSGARYEILVVLGNTLALQDSADVVADIASNGSRVFLSNLSKSRLDVFPVGARRITDSVSVGSLPWGMAFGPGNDTLYVANSGGTNISVVSPGGLSEVRRIQTPNVKLFDVSFDAQRIVNPAAAADTMAADSVTALFPGSVARFDYSDRPQFIGVTQNRNLIYSTRPTGAAPDGTLRVYRKAQDRLEIVTEYAEERVAGRLVVANADSAFLVASKPFNLIQVCPRPRSRNPSLDRALPVRCFTGPIDWVQDSLATLGYDTEFRYSVNIEEIGLSDTTFVAVSGDHGTVAFGEGARNNARVMVVEDRSSDPADDPLVKFGEIRDIVGNTAERVIGLALNRDGTLGVARGRQAFYFDRNLRLQGVADPGSPSGGVDMNPANTGRGVSYVSGVTAAGLAYIDVVDTFTFRSRGRIFMRDPVTGPLKAVEVPGGVMIYAVTARGVVQLEVP